MAFLWIPEYFHCRCGIYPGWILRSTLFDAIRLSSMFPAYYIFNGLLCLLQVLHIVWTYLLFKVIIVHHVYNMLTFDIVGFI